MPGISDKQVKDAHAHFTGLGGKDRLAKLVAERGPLDLGERRRGRPQDAYGALVRSIAGQQLSVKAAAAIYQRLLDYFDGSVPTPEQILAAEPEEMRAAAGLSRSKVAFLRSLAEHVTDGSLDLAALGDLSDEDVVAALTEVKGLGVWTSHMFLLFHLGRPDVWPVGDLGVRRAVERLYGLDELPGPEDMTRLAEPWRPWRSVAALYLWDSLSNAPD